ncbi:YbgC/FadM family acyl-CoA thioesterase [Altererythrobacter salegens]|uniref:YbgC/FadM family acyl-CoA thioesterase n=1 Tax=Croceibacterium salegens TaxID=1737568 RepID=A0A6I4ST61_9SPHN|nr:YbgC/FadM family acyl-CoA thioesterase [Croceibacterium salegens]MXO58197.1 YbgC/FadM family acyl-CoA thioesterase [Croceibacterium salegens]
MTTCPKSPSGVLDGTTHRFPMRVYFEDTDLTGVVYHSNYLKWFERARTEMMRLVGIEQRATHEGGGGAYAVAEISIRYLSPARLDDEIVIESRPVELRAASCRIAQRALRGDTVLAEAQLRVGFVGPDGKPRRQPLEWRAAFAQLMDVQGTA